MMKKIQIQIVVDEQNVATGMKIEGLNKDNLHDQLELLGIIRNMEEIVLDKIKTKAKLSK